MADLLNCHQKWSNCLLQFQVYLHHYMVMFLDNQLNCRTGSTRAYRICVRTMQPTAMRLGIHNSEIIDKFSKPLKHFIWTFHKNSSRSFRTKQWQLPYRGIFFSVGTEGHCRPKDPHPYKRIGWFHHCQFLIKLGPLQCRCSEYISISYVHWGPWQTNTVFSHDYQLMKIDVAILPLTLAIHSCSLFIAVSGPKLTPI